MALTRGEAFIIGKFSQSKAKAQGDVAAECTQTLTLIRSVRAMGAEILQQQRFAQCNGLVRSLTLLEVGLWWTLTAVKEYVLAATLGIFGWYFGMRIIRGLTPLGSAYSFITVRS